MGWIIVGVVLVILFVLLICKITIIFDRGDKIFLKVSYLFFTVYKYPANSRKNKKKDRKVKSAVKKSKKKTKKEAEKLSFSDIVTLVKFLPESMGKPLKKMMKRTEFSHIRVDITAGGEDAARAAINFGKINIAVGNALGFIDSFFTLKSIDDIHVGVDFELEKTSSSYSGEIMLSLAAAIAFTFTVIVKVFRYCSKDDNAKQAVLKMTR